MESSFEPALTIVNALPAYRWNVDYTDKVVGKITQEIFDWRPPSPDGSWQFALGEIAAHIADAAYMFWGQLTGEEIKEENYLMKYPEGEPRGEWTRNREFGSADVTAYLKEVRGRWEDILGWPIEKAHEPTVGTIKAFETHKKLAEEGKFPKEALANGPATPVRVLATVISHEAGHRGSLIAYLRAFHGVSFEQSH